MTEETTSEIKSPTDAAAKLAELKNSPSWTAAYLQGSADHVAEFEKLSTLARGVDQIDLQIAGKPAPGLWLNSEHRDGIHTAQLLRDAHVHEATVARQVLSGEEVSRAEHDAAAATKARLMQDANFVRSYLSGNSDAVRQVMLLSIVLTRGVKEAA